MDTATWILLVGTVLALLGWVINGYRQRPNLRSFGAACSALGLWFLGAAMVWDRITIFNVILSGVASALALLILIKEAMIIRKESGDGKQS